MYVTLLGGSRLNLLLPDISLIHIKDIARNLSRINRFCGNTKYPYSVAEHCVVASYRASTKQESLSLLLHDASEAYLGDLPSYIKEVCPEYKKVEDNLLTLIFNSHNIDPSFMDTIKPIDKEVTEEERQKLVCSSSFKRLFNPFYYNPSVINCLGPYRAESSFLRRYKELTL